MRKRAHPLQAVRALFFLNAASVFMLAAPPFAHAEDTSALEDLRLGYALKKKGQCVEAIARFDAALRKAPSARGYLNRADCEESLAQYTRSYTSLVLGLQRAEQERDQELVDLARARLEATRPKIALLTITMATQEGVEIELDGKALSEFGKVPVEPGIHVVRAKVPGKAPFSEQITLHPGEEKSLDVRFVELSEPPRADTRPTPAMLEPLPPSPPSMPWRTLGLVGAGIGAVQVGVGVVLGLTAKSSYNDATTTYCRRSICTAEGVRLTDAARSQAQVATWVVVGGSVLAAAGITIFLVAPKSSTKDGQAHVSIRGDGVWVEGRY